MTNYLISRKNELIKLRADVVQKIKSLKYKGNPRLYVRIDTGKDNFYISDKSGKIYKCESNDNKKAIAEQVANYDYLRKILRMIDRELKLINQFLPLCGKTPPEDYYGSLCEGRQKLIIPIRQTDEQYVEAWLSEPYERSSISFDQVEFYTDKNERVRSKSEILIANALNKYNVPYKYECPIYTEEMGVIHPDFTALNVKRRKLVYWEHLGKMDDEEYARDNTYRINVYEKNGIFMGDNLIVTWETSKMPLDVKLMEDKIKHYLLE